MACILLHTMLRGVPNLKAEFGQMATVMSMKGDIPDSFTIETITTTLARMEESGRHYRLWEDDIGRGLAVGLGSGLHESQ